MCYETSFENYLHINEDGTATVTISYMGWHDVEVRWEFANGALTFTDGNTEEIFTLSEDKKYFLDTNENYYFPTENY